MKLRTVGYLSDPNIVTFTKRCWSMKCKKPGIDVEYLNLALRLAGLEAEVIPFDYGVAKAISMITNGSADMTVHAIVQSSDRLQAVDFTIPVNYVVYGYLVKEVEEFQVKEFIINSLCPEVILLLALGLLTSPIAMWIFSSYKRSYWDWLFYSARTLLKQDTPHHTIRYTLSNAFFLISWIWFCFFFTLYFESAMKSRLTLSAKKGYEFENLDGLLNAVEKRGWKVMVQDEVGWNPMDFCKNSHDQCSRLQHAVKQALHISQADDPFQKLPPSAVMFAALHNHMVPSDVVIVDKRRRVLFIKDSSLQPGILSYAINKNLSKTLEKINKGLERIQGSYENLVARYDHPYIPYTRHDGLNEFFELRLVYLWPLFRLCIGFIGVSIGIFIIEIFVAKSRVHIHLIHEECHCGEKAMAGRHFTRRSLNALSLIFRKKQKYETNFRNLSIS